ncbi:MAG: hypothetical protein LH606_18935, partial [Cytophagaceae bacterium]|nr:hypothetical protein [Cytophagaceae bacterium]
MTTPDDTLTPGEDRHADNELKKLRLELEHGAKFFEGSTKASPELMGDWLDHVANYEAQHKNARMLTVYTYVGQPNFRDETDLTDEEIGPELERLLQLMADNDVVLDVLAPEDYDDRTLYRFVTEELFIEGTDDIRIPGSFKHFTYEEFHPNPRYDVVNRCAEFIELLAKGNFDKLTWGMDSPFYDRTQSPHGFKARPEVRQKLDELVARWHPMVVLD